MQSADAHEVGQATHRLVAVALTTHATQVPAEPMQTAPMSEETPSVDAGSVPPPPYIPVLSKKA